MSRMKLFGRLFGADSGNAALLLRAYGKLPLYAEYRRLEVTAGSPTQFSQWLDEGRLAWARSPTRSPNGVTRGTRMLMTLPGAKETVVARLWDSRDSLGRVFPFCFFVCASPDALGASLAEQWVSACWIHLQFEALHAELSALGRGGDFYRHYQKRQISPRPDDAEQRLANLRQQAAKISAEAWVRAAAGEGADAAQFGGVLLRRAQRWRTPEAAGDLALSIPLAAGSGADELVVLFSDWLAPVLAAAGRAAKVVAPCDAAAGQAFQIVTREILIDDYQLATSDEPAYRFVEHVAAANGDPAPPTPVAGTLASWLAQHPLG